MSTKHAGKAQITALLARSCCFMAMLAQMDIFLNVLKYTQNPGCFIYSQTLINKCTQGLNWDFLCGVGWGIHTGASHKKIEYREKVYFFIVTFQKVKLSYILDSLHVK